MADEITQTTGTAAPGAAAPAAPSGAQPSSSPATTADNSQGSAQPGQQVDGLKQLRETYESLKAKYEPWDKLGAKPEQFTQYSGVYQKLHGEVAAIGRELGFPDEEIAEALAEDPVRTLDFLRNQLAQADQNRQQPGGQQDLNELVAQHVEQVIGPIQQRENTRMTNEANSLFERTVHQAAVDTFKAEGLDVAQIPPDEMDFLMTATSEILKYDADALKALKYEGKTAPIQKAFQEAKTYLDKYYLSRSARDKARVQPPARPGQPQPQAGKRPSLDEIIDNPGVLGKQYA